MTFIPRDFLLIAKIHCNFPRDVAMDFKCTIAESLGKKVIATFNFTKFLSNINKFVKNNSFMNFSLIKQVYLANHIEILLHDHFSGCNEIAKSLGTQFFIPRGFAPWDEKLLSLGICNFIASLKMIVQ